MSDDREQRIRDHAYRLWEAEGRPAGRHDDHWRDATDAVDGATDIDKVVEQTPVTEVPETITPPTTPAASPAKAKRRPATKARQPRKTLA